MHGAYMMGVLALLFAGAVSGAPLACSTSGLAEVCVTVDASLEASIRSCVDTGSAAAASGEIAVSGGLTGKTPFVTSPSTDGTMVCAGGVATLQVSATASVVQLADNLPLEGTLLTAELAVRQTGEGSLDVEWAGTLVGGKIGSAASSGVSLGFAVGKASPGDAVSTTLYVDIADLGDEVGMDLPSRLTYTEAGLPFFDESIVGAVVSCPFNTLSVLPQLSIPDVSAALQVSAATVDVCAFVAEAEGAAPFVRVAAGIASAVSVNGLSLEGLSVEVTAKHAGAGTVAWGGSLSASVTVFDTVASAVSAQFSTTALEALEVQVAVTKPAFSVDGTVAYASGGCTSANTGSVTVSVPSAGLSAVGTITQKDGCGADGKTAEWDITVVSTDALDVSGVEVKDVNLELASAVAADGVVSWAGSIRGTVELGTGNSASAAISFDGAAAKITSFDVQGSVAIGPVSGGVSLSVADGVMTGSGSLAFVGADAESSLPAFTAQVTHVSTYTPDNADLPLWDVAGQLASFEASGFTLSDVHVALQGRLQGQDASVAWTGSFEGASTLEGSTVTLRADIADNKFSSLTGTVAVSGNGVAFAGQVEIAAGGGGCATVTGDGELTLTATSHVFTASLNYDKCATTAGAVKFAVTGTAQQVGFEALTLSSAVVELTGKVPSTGSALVWEGTLTASANLFGGSSQASVAFAGGKLQTVSLSSLFMTSNGLLSSTFGLEYVNSCDTPSTGSGTATLRLKGADDLVFNAGVSYHKCTGAMELAGSVAGSWNGPAGTRFTGMTVALAATGSGDETLSSRKWTGTITATTSAGLSAEIAVTTGSESSVEATLTYTDADKVLVSATVGTDCKGTGMVSLTNLPYSIPAMELEVSFSKPCGQGSTKEWTVSGQLSELKIPFFGKSITLPSPTVQVSSDAAGKKTVSIKGPFLGDYELDLSIPLPLKAADITLRGGLLSGKAVSPGGFASAWQGSGSAFASSLGAGAPGLFDGLEALPLGNVGLEVSFGGSLSLTASGNAFGLAFDVAVGVAKSGSAWNYGMAFTASGASVSSPSGMPAVVGNVLKQLAPTYVRFSVAKAKMTIQGVELRQGFSLAAFLGADSGVMQSVKSIAPSSLKSQITSAEGSGSGAGLTVVADIQSTTQMNVFVMLAGNIPLGSPKVVLKEVALAFVVKTGPPEFGFNVVLDFTVGSGGNAQTFTTAGFISLSATGSLTVALSVDSPQPWSKPFGIPGVKVLFPLGVKMTITPALLPSQFALIGGMQIAGVTGTVALGADLQDFTKTAFKGEVLNLDFKRIITDIAECNSCLGPVGGVIADMSLEKFSASFNPDPVNPVVIQIADVSATIPAGIHIDVQDLELWGVVRIAEATFSVSSGGMEASFVADKIDWSVIQITSADGKSGPSFSMALTPSKQHLKVDGRAKILGRTVTLLLELSDSKVFGSFTYSIGSGMSVAVTLDTQGRPGKSGFKNTITGTMKADVISTTVTAATDFLYDLKKDADSDLAAANKDLQDAKADLDAANKDLQDAKNHATSKISGAQRTVDNLSDDVDSKKDSCKKKEKKCKKKPWTCGSVATCWTAYGVLKGSLEAAEETLRAVKKTVQGAVTAAQGTVDAAKGTVTATQATVNVAQGVVDAFGDLTRAVGGALKNALRIHSLTFSNTLTNSATAVAFAVDMTIANTRVQYGFNVKLSYTEFKDAIYTEFRRRMKASWGNKIPKL